MERIMPMVRVVTPGSVYDRHPSIDAFEDELLNRLGWAIRGIDENVYWANYNIKQLKINAKAAVNEKPDVIIASGSMAATILQSLTTKIPIIQALGGCIPHNKKKNLTGFQITEEKTAQEQLDMLTTKKVTVLYDPTNEPFLDKTYEKLEKQAIKAGKTLFPQKVSSPADLKQIQIEDGSSFMLLPNAMYYNHCADIAKIVERKRVPAVYPEREYLLYTHPLQKGVRVHGHHVPIAYRHTAILVDNILRQILSKTFKMKLPDFQEAPRDHF
jgi:ABC-type uncharacterized transport system substrate-binding protein